VKLGGQRENDQERNNEPAVMQADSDAEDSPEVDLRTHVNTSAIGRSSVSVTGSSRIYRNAVIPLIPASWMSIKMRSGWHSRVSRTSSLPVWVSTRRFRSTLPTAASRPVEWRYPGTAESRRSWNRIIGQEFGCRRMSKKIRLW